MRIHLRYGQSDLHDLYLLITRTPSTNRRRSAVTTGCADSHSSLSIASSVPSNSAFAANSEADAALLPRPASCDCPDRFILVFANARMGNCLREDTLPCLQRIYSAFRLALILLLSHCCYAFFVPLGGGESQLRITPTFTGRKYYSLPLSPFVLMNYSKPQSLFMV